MSKRYIFHMLLALWIILVFLYTYLIIVSRYGWSTVAELVMFTLLGIQLLIIDVILSRLMKELFGKQVLEKSF